MTKDDKNAASSGKKNVKNTRNVPCVRMYANRVKNTRSWKEWIYSLGPCIKAAF